MFSLGRQQDQDTLELVRNANFQSPSQIGGIRNSGSEPAICAWASSPGGSYACSRWRTAALKRSLGTLRCSLTGLSFSMSNLQQLLLVQHGAAHMKVCTEAAVDAVRADLRICFWWSRSASLWSSLLRSTASDHPPLATNRCCSSRLGSSVCPFSVQNNSRKTVLYHTHEAKPGCFYH